MKKTSKLIIFVLALCVMAFSTYAVAAADGEEQEPVWTVEANYPSFDEAAKDIFAYDNPFDYLTVKKDDEVVAYDDLIACGTYNAAKEKGLVRSEGKEYVMKDGDVVVFRFNV